ncbi:uncharacterized protein CMU_010770 [Cryptosporidium muris RN66]|uniref:Uncharacterized protein n=1 Tax=Cryptosporidium muris (strain RN66) TaxID=441375 RepID=B6AIT8_CRYMR|nr:uncharacterized protein CMU_010770 [Cryptosporidium muris RN66]EEA08129.1 hypothetical protein, conserved [Cryptosporidium muris RN66]|eukprot:XP_002142478.1 hypothetical protein [Cryptosporidium muris RN66]
MSNISRSQLSALSTRVGTVTCPLLIISPTEFEQVWREVKWDISKVNAVVDLFISHCEDDIKKNSKQILMSNFQLMELLKVTGLSCYSNRGGFSSLQRNDLCSIVMGVPFIDKKNFLRLMCLLDRSTPHTTTTPAGICRLKLVFAFYDWGWKGYWDSSDWSRLRSDLMTRGGSTSNSSDISPMPLTLAEGIRQLTRDISIRKRHSALGGKESPTANQRVGGLCGRTGGTPPGTPPRDFADYLASEKSIVDFQLFQKFVEYRIIKGTSQLLRIILPDSNADIANIKKQDVNLNETTIQLNDSILLTKKKSNNLELSDVSSLENKLRSTHIGVKLVSPNIQYSPIINSASIGVSFEANAMEAMFGPPPRDLHGIFSDKIDTEDIFLSSIVGPSSSTPVKKSRSSRLPVSSSPSHSSKNGPPVLV